MKFRLLSTFEFSVAATAILILLFAGIAINKEYQKSNAVFTSSNAIAEIIDLTIMSGGFLTPDKSKLS
jgi:hypothetical protein